MFRSSFFFQCINLLSCTLSWLVFSLCPDPSLQTVALEDGDVSEDVPRVGLEEMLREMRISDREREEGGGED